MCQYIPMLKLNSRDKITARPSVLSFMEINYFVALICEVKLLLCEQLAVVLCYQCQTTFLAGTIFQRTFVKISHITSQHSVQYPHSKTNRYFATAEHGCLLESARTSFDHRVCIAITHRSLYLQYFSYETYRSTFLSLINKYELKYPIIGKNSYVLKRNMCSLKEH